MGKIASSILGSPVPLPTGKDWLPWAKAIALYLGKLQKSLNSSGGGSSSINKLSVGACGLATFANLSSEGACVVQTSQISSNTLVLLTLQADINTIPSGSVFEDKTARVPGVSFTIRVSDSNDQPVVAWLLVEPLT